MLVGSTLNRSRQAVGRLNFFIQGKHDFDVARSREMCVEGDQLKWVWP